MLQCVHQLVANCVWCWAASVRWVYQSFSVQNSCLLLWEWTKKLNHTTIGSIVDTKILTSAALITSFIQKAYGHVRFACIVSHIVTFLWLFGRRLCLTRRLPYVQHCFTTKYYSRLTNLQSWKHDPGISLIIFLTGIL